MIYPQVGAGIDHVSYCVCVDSNSASSSCGNVPPFIISTSRYLLKVV